MNDEKKEGAQEQMNDVRTPEQLKEFLLNIRDRMADRSAAPIYALSALNHVMNQPNIYDLLNKDNKELARDIWLHLRQAGFQLKNPPLLFDENGEDVAPVGS